MKWLAGIVYLFIISRYGSKCNDLRGKCVEASRYLWAVLNSFGIQAKIRRGFFVLDHPRSGNEGITEELHTWLTARVNGDEYLIDLTVRQFKEGCSLSLPPYLLEKSGSEFSSYYRENSLLTSRESGCSIDTGEIEIFIKKFLKSEAEAEPIPYHAI